MLTVCCPLTAWLLLHTSLASGLVISARPTRLLHQQPKTHQKILRSPGGQPDTTQEDLLCVLKSCQTRYLPHLPPQITCSWTQCNEPLTQGVPGLPGAYIAETLTDTHLSVRTKRWQFADSLQMCMNMECVGLSGDDLYQCTYNKCVFVKTS